jgi:hypothetical protein
VAERNVIALNCALAREATDKGIRWRELRP